MSYDFQLETIIRFLSTPGCRGALFQLPDGLKPHALDLKEEVERSVDVDIHFSLSHTWGGCDLALSEAKALGTSHLIHFGHHGPVRIEVPETLEVLFIPAYSTVDVADGVSEAANRLGDYSRLGLTASIQHVHKLVEAEKILRSHGFQVSTRRSRATAMQRGQITGCDLAAATLIGDRVEAHLVVSSGVFHALGVALATGKPTLRVDPLSGRVEEVTGEAERTIKLRLHWLMKAMDAERFGILVSAKGGQFRPRLAREAERLLRESGKKTVKLVGDDLEPERLANFTEVEVYLNTACPRLALDNMEEFRRPIVNAGELRRLLSGSLEGYTGAEALRYSL